MATFITSKSVGQTMNIYVQTSTGFWKYNHDGSDSSMFGNGNQTITVANVNGEFTIISCLSDGTVSGDITQLNLGNNLLTSFDGTSLTSLTNLNLYNNQLTSLVGFIFPTSLTTLQLGNNQLTSFDATGLPNLVGLVLTSNPLTPSVNNQILNQLNQNGLSGGYFESNNGRSSASIADYNNLVSLGWEFSGLQIIDTTTPPTFITSKSIGDSINIYVKTSTGFWKYNHDGSDSSVLYEGEGYGDLTITNANGEFTIISCDESGNASGDVAYLTLQGNQLTSFDGTGLSSLTGLYLNNNQLTSFDGTGLSGLTELYLYDNQLTSFDGTDLSSLTYLELQANQLTSFDGTGLSSLTYLGLGDNPLTTFIGGDMGLITSLNFQDWNITTLTSFDGTGLSSLTELYLQNNQFTSFDGTGLSSLTYLTLQGNQLTSFDGTGLSSLTILGLNNNQFISFDGTGLSGLTHLDLYNNQLTSFDGTGLSSLTSLGLNNNQLTSFNGTGLSNLTTLQLGINQLTSFDGTGLTSLTNLNLYNNQLTSLDVSMMTLLNSIGLCSSKEGTNPMTATSNDAILAALVTNGLIGTFQTGGGRTLASNSDYDNLVSLGWNLQGLDVVIPPTFITSKAVGESINIHATTSTGFWKYKHGGVVSSVNVNGWVNSMPVTNANGEFAIIPCLSDGTVSGDITRLRLENIQLTSFDGTGLSSLIELRLQDNQLTSFDGTDLSSLPGLNLGNNQLTSLDGFIFPTSLTDLGLSNNLLTSFDGTGLSSLTDLILSDNQLTSFDGTGLSSLTSLELHTNQLTSFDGTDLSGLTYLDLNTNQLTSFDGTGLSSLGYLDMTNNELTSFDGTGLTSLGNLSLNGNPLTSFDIAGLTSLTSLSLLDLQNTQSTPYVNNQILHQLSLNGLTWGYFLTVNGRTSEGTSDYDSLIANSFNLSGLDLLPTFITSKAVGESININVQTSTGYWKYNHDGSDSSVFGGGDQTITVLNINGEFTIISCDSDGTVSGNITYLNLPNNQLTSFDGTGLSGLTGLGLGENQLTSFDGTGLSGLIDLNLSNNQLTSFDGTGLSSLIGLYLNGNPMTTSSNNQILQQLSQNEISVGDKGAEFYSSNGRTSVSDIDYDNLVSLGWYFEGLDLIIPPTFITSKAVGETINIYVETSTEYWKYNHDGSDSSVFDQGDGYQTITVSNVNGEFTIIPCDSDGTVNGNVTRLNLQSNQITSFDGTDLSGLTYLDLNTNQLTSFDGTGLSSLGYLDMTNNELTSFDGTGLTSLTQLNLDSNQLTSFDATDLSSLTSLNLGENQFTSFNGTGLSSLTYLDLRINQLTSFDVTGLSSLTQLYLPNNQLTSSANNQILNQLNQNGLSGGEFYSSNGRTSASNTDYDNLLNNLGWYFEGLDLIIPPTFITSKAVGETIWVNAFTSTGYWKYNHDGSDSSVYNPENDIQGLIVTNINGEFTILPCDVDGNTNGIITRLILGGNDITSFDGTGLTDLYELHLQNNQLTSFDGTSLSGLLALSLSDNQLTSFDGTDLTNLVSLTLNNNQLTSINLTGCINLHMLNVSDNPSINQPSINNNVISLYAANTRLHGWGENGMPFGGSLTTSGGRWPSSNVDYNYLVTAGGINGSIELVPGPTFITSKAVGETINIYVETSTEYWKYNHDGSDSSVFANGSQSPTVTNVNGEFTLISCDSDGNISGDVTYLSLGENQITSFDGTGLSSLTTLYLNENQLTSFDGTGLSGLTTLILVNNQLTSLDGTGLSSLINLDLAGNQLTPSSNNQVLQQLNQNGLSGGEFYSSNGRTSASNTDYDNLLNNLGWYFEGLDLIATTPPTFITSKSVGQTIWVNAFTSTGYWKYNHDGSDSIVFNQEDGEQLPTISNANGEFTIISCLSDGTVSGDITILTLPNNQLTSFDGTGLSSLTYLELNDNQLTSFDGTDLSSLTNLYLESNLLTSIDVTDLSSLTNLDLPNNQLTSFDGTGLSSLTDLDLTGPKGSVGTLTLVSNLPTSLAHLFLGFNQLTSIDVTGLTSLIRLYLESNLLTSIDVTGLSSLTELYLQNNQLTSFDGTGLSSLTSLILVNNQLTSFDGTGLYSLIGLNLNNNQLTSFDGTGLSGLTNLYLENNQLTPSLNNQILNQLNQNGLSDGTFYSSNGRTTASNADYDNLISLGWTLEGLAVGNGKLRVKGVNSGGVPTQPWDGGTIYNIGAVVTHEGQTWNCIQYAPSGYGPFGGHIDVYWTL